VLGIQLSPAEIAGLIEMPFVELTHVGPRNHVLDAVKIPFREGENLGFVRLMEMYWESLLRVCNIQLSITACTKRDNSVLNNGMTV